MSNMLEDATDVLIVLLYAPGRSGQVGEPINGITRIQKLLFLIQQQDNDLPALVEDAKEYTYSAYKMGPYSSTLRDELAQLQAAGIVVTERLEFLVSHDADDMEDPDAAFEGFKRDKRRVESFRYRLSADLGMKIGLDLWKKLPERTRKSITDFKDFFNSITLRQLLVYVYKRYASFTTESKIKRQLGLS